VYSKGTYFTLSGKKNTVKTELPSECVNIVLPLLLGDIDIDTVGISVLDKNRLVEKITKVDRYLLDEIEDNIRLALGMQ
jgi:hypothetical protein